MDEDACYRAVAGRDRRFEGRFVVAVRTTGVYCRPGCPARIPQRRNVRFFACAAAAESAGYRPCLRCRPDAAPDSPAWNGSASTVSRALRLIAEGDEDGSADALAGRLGVGARHLRRLFALHLGASPQAVARTRRAHFARRLLESTALPLTEVAHAAGYGSVRRFNAALQSTFGRTPSQLRRRAPARPSLPGDPLVLQLPFRPPLDWEALAAWLAARAVPGVEVVTGAAYCRTVAVGGSVGTIEVRPGGPRHLELRACLGALDGLAAITAAARRLFDLDADPAPIMAHLGRDPLLARAVAARPGLRVPGAFDRFELAVRAVLGQQISVGQAARLAGRIAAHYGAPLPTPVGELTRLFPTAAALARADLGPLGLTRQRAGAVRALAEAVAAGAPLLDGTVEREAAVARLAALPGVGAWTAETIALRALGEPDAFPASDLGLRRRLGLPPATLTARAEGWRPWRAYAAMHLWTDEEGDR
jgi:AraC family transcriptional regulator of adaptative response / DNA-3-methyladenine glycosylase II